MKSAIEKARDRLLEKGQSDLVTKVDNMHKILKTKLNGGNIKDAQNAENFLNWLIFNKGSLGNSEIDKIYKNELLNNNALVKNIQNKFLGLVSQSQEYNKKFSEVASKEAVNKLLKEYGTFSQNRGIETEKLFVELANGLVNAEVIQSTGAQSSTVVVERFNQKLLSQMGEQGEVAIKKLIKDGKKFRYVGRSMKSDTKGGNIQYTVSIIDLQNYIQSCIEVFSDSSIKSVNNIERIHLENVDVLKAYSAFMKFSYSNKFMTQKAIKNIFNYYYGQDNNEDKEYITRHLNHLFRVYAYSGFGTAPINDLNNISKGVKYLIVVDNINQYIYVKSSSEVVDFLLTHPVNKNLQSDVYLNLSALLNKKH